MRGVCASVLAAAILLAVALGGCSSSHPAPGGTVAEPPASSAYVPGPADDAATIASHIPGCRGVATGDVGGGGPSLVSTAHCVLQGHVVIVDGWASAADAKISGALTPDAKVYYAYGSTWTAFLGDQGATASTTVLQMQLTNDAAGVFNAASDPPSPVPVPTQRALLGPVAKALGGTLAVS